MSTQKIESLHFSIEGGWLTELSRTLWADEDQPEKAVNLLRSTFPEMQIHDIFGVLCGSWQLVGDEHGMTLEEDSAEVSKHGNSLNILRILKIARNQEDQDLLKDILALESDSTLITASRHGLIAIPFWRKRAWEAGEVTLDDIPYRQVGSDPTEFTAEELRAAQPGLSLFERVEAVGRRGQEKEESEPGFQPPPDPSYSIDFENGWLSPDGKFYRCLWMEHGNLAQSLTEDVDGEKLLEQRGWVRVQTSLTSDGTEFRRHSRKTTSQKQIDLIFDWSQKHKKKLPWWLQEEFKE